LKSVGMVHMENADRTSQRAIRDEARESDYRLKGRAADILAGGLEALDSLHIGVAVINGLREVLFANETAHQILAAGDGLEVTAHGVLSTSKRNLIPFLGAKGRTPANARVADSVVALPRSRGRRPLIVLFRPFNGTEDSANLRSPAVLVFMLDPELPIPPVESGLRELYGFTSCEARLAHLLMEGHALKGCCEQLGIRASTARMHLTSMFGKVGVQRQEALVGLLLKSVCMVRTSRAGRTICESPVRISTTTRFPATDSELGKSEPSTLLS